MLFANRDSSTSSFPIWMSSISHRCQTALARTSSRVLSKSGDWTHTRQRSEEVMGRAGSLSFLRSAPGALSSCSFQNTYMFHLLFAHASLNEVCLPSMFEDGHGVPFIAVLCLSWWAPADSPLSLNMYKGASDSAHTHVAGAAHSQVFPPVQRPAGPPPLPASMGPSEPRTEAPSPRKTC